MPHPSLMLDDQTLLDECQLQHTRRSGPGGQHRNKVSTAVVLLHRPTGLRAEGSERRSQLQNRQQALERLRLQLALGQRVAVEAAEYRPSELWRSRLHGTRLVVSCSHRDYPSLVAEALDVMAAVGGGPATAAKLLGCTTSQLIKLLRAEAQVWQSVNRQRLQQGWQPLQ